MKGKRYFRWSFISTPIFFLFFSLSVLFTVNCGGGGGDTTACKKNSDCADGKICKDGKCTADSKGGCKADSDCNTGETCNNGKCEKKDDGGCKDDGDCNTGETCNNGKCEKKDDGGCKDDGDCNTGETCNNGKCEKKDDGGCKSDADCNADETCNNGKCEKKQQGGCKSDADCKAPTPKCDGNAGKCVECLDNVDCGQGKECKANKCESAQGECQSDADCQGKPKKFCSDQQKCEWECKKDEDCGKNAKCVNNACQKDTPSGCKKDADCGGNTPVCDTKANKCVECLQDSDCKDPKKPVCNGNACVAQQSASCTPACKADEFCFSGEKCLKKFKNCQTDKDCGANEGCVSVERGKVCLTKCDTTKNKSKTDFTNPACWNGYGYCLASSSTSKTGYCLPPLKKIRKLGETCAHVWEPAKPSYHLCSANLFCFDNVCLKKCDPKKNDCAQDELCYPLRTGGGVCRKTCDPTKGKVNNPACPKMYYCYTNTTLKKSYCRKLPDKKQGPKQLGEDCSNYTPSKFCDGSKGLICKYPKCVKACDPGKGKDNNPDCGPNEECLEETFYSYLGGYCSPKPTQKEGEPCDKTTKRCVQGLVCYQDVCHKKCTKDADCGQNLACYKYYNACVTKCDPKKARLGPPCKQGFYCSSSSSVPPGYCKPLPKKKVGPKKLGEDCSNFTKSRFCDGNADLVCLFPKCAKACDPLKGENNNPNCKANEVCTFYINSHLGGVCKPKPTQKEGDPCNSTTKRCIKGLVCKSNVCVPLCDPKKARLGPPCKQGYYCASSSITPPGYCKPLPKKKVGPKKLGEDCSNYNKSRFCDGNADLVCKYPKCVKGCDPLKGENNNPNCKANEVCTFFEDSHLGGICLTKPTQNEGDPCDDITKRCVKGLVCKSKVCVPICDPKKARVGPPCKKGYYCTSSYITPPGYCTPLPNKKVGPKKLGESCSNVTKSKFCDGNSNLFCDYPKCAKACDLTKGKTNNPDCGQNEECVFNRYSFLGGKCQKTNSP